MKDRRSTVPHVLLKVQWFAGVSRSKRQELFVLRVSESGRSQRLEREREQKVMIIPSSMGHSLSLLEKGDQMSCTTLLIESSYRFEV